MIDGLQKSNQEDGITQDTVNKGNDSSHDIEMEMVRIKQDGPSVP